MQSAEPAPASGSQVPSDPDEPAAPDQLSEQALRASRTYGAAADHYRLGSLAFWDRFGAATVARLPLRAGQAVLDMCCGAGASAIPAARAVGPGGRVLGVDVARPLLDLGRSKAAAEQLPNVEFRYADATSTGLASGSLTLSCACSSVPRGGHDRVHRRDVAPGRRGVLTITTLGSGAVRTC
jgi:SAM-dependent methyltransferase